MATLSPRKFYFTGIFLLNLLNNLYTTRRACIINVKFHKLFRNAMIPIKPVLLFIQNVSPILKSTRIIHHNQTLMTKIAINQPMTSKVQLLCRLMY